MTGNVGLLIPLVGVFVGLSLAVVATFVLPSERAGVSRSLAGIQRTGVTGVPGVPVESFTDRLLLPAFRSLGRLGRRCSPAGANAKLGRLLDLAGNPPQWNVEKIFGLKGLGLIGLGLLGALFGRHSPLLLMAFTALGGLAGFYLPDILLYNAGAKREERLRKSLPDALDLLTISVEAGLGFDAALSQVSRNTDGPLAGEFFRVLQEMQIGKSRAEAFTSLGERSRVPELRTFVTALTQADSFGIPIANVLREQSREMRVKRRQRAEEKAQKVPVKILFPMIFFIFPAMFVVILGPGAISIYRALIQH